MNYLRKIEPQLASLWRAWTRTKRLAKLATRFGLKNAVGLVNLHSMYKSNKKFWATNEPKYLARAIGSYFKLRRDWELNPTTSPIKVTISGWASKNTLGEIRELFAETSIRREFRPDVWYLQGKRAGLFSGFQIDVSLNDFERISAELMKRVPKLERNSFPENLDLRHSSIGGRLESISPTWKRGEVSWFSAYYISPTDFTSIVEATSDKEVAALALALFAQLSTFDRDAFTVTSLAKFCLVLGFVPSDVEFDGWIMARIRKPVWRNTERQQFGSTKTSLPPVFSEVEDAVTTNGGVITKNGHFLDWDQAQHPRLDFVAGNANFVIGSHANLEFCFLRVCEKSETIEQGILLGSRVDSNWFHFMIETLPRLLLVDKDVPKEVPVIVSRRIPSTALEAIRIVTARKIIQVDQDKSVRVIRAILPGPVIFHPDTQFFWGNQDESYLNSEVLRELSRIILAELSPTPGTKHTYWERRSQYRNITNSKSIGSILRRRGFESKDPSSVSFAQQVQSIHESSALVAVGGALMSNFIFARKGAKIILLVSDFGRQYAMPRFLANIAGASIEYVGGRSVRRHKSHRLSIVEKSHSSFKTNIKSLSRFLN